MFFGNLVGVIPSVATAPALVIIGLFMLQPVIKLCLGKFKDIHLILYIIDFLAIVELMEL
jgi:xanthine/uracil/vitamin C permease (AzgA family)